MDIVTDDMPYLVDSVLMAVHRCGLEVHEVIHPQLRVIRDVGGTMHGVLGVSDGSPATHDEIKESWIHLETSTLSGPGEAAELAADLERVLGDVRAAVEDYPKMHARALTLADTLARTAPPVADEAETAAETEALLRWLADGHFTFLGYREYDLVDGADGMQLTAVPGTGLGILRHDRPASSAFAALPPEVRAKATEPRLLIVTKANSMSTVHRPHYLDYIAVKRFGPDGKVTGERRFLGLYTHSAYSESITRIPVLRRKLAGVLAATGLAADSHDGNDLAEFLENYPREELFQIPVPELIPIADGVLRLRDRKQTRLFLRKDPYGRYMSCLVYMPRDRYTTAIRLRAQEILRTGARRRVGQLQRDGRRVGGVPAAHRGAGGPRQDAARRGRGRPGTAAGRGHPVLGRRPGRGDPPGDGRGRGPVPARAVRRRDPGHLQGRRARRGRGRRPGPDRRAAGVG